MILFSNFLFKQTAYRGHDLGGLLFTEAIAALRHRYMRGSESSIGNSADDYGTAAASKARAATVVRCRLDVEEDTRRHNRLVRFYEELGCSAKPTKVRYINNNDGESYRKVVMQFDLSSSSCDDDNDENIATVNAGTEREQGVARAVAPTPHHREFLPIEIYDATGRGFKTRVAPPSASQWQAGCRSGEGWLVFDVGNGCAEIRTTRGRRVTAEPKDGCCCAVMPVQDGDENDNWACFRILKTSDSEELDEDEGNDISSPRTVLWSFESFHGTYLSLDSSRRLCCSRTPSFWVPGRGGGDASFVLTRVRDTPALRWHCRKYWQKQTVEYVMAMRERYLSFNRRRMSLREALDLAGSFPACRFNAKRDVRSPSLRTHCFRAAEKLRAAGHPDWVQFLALMYYLGGVVKCIDEETAMEAGNDFDWTIPSPSGVVGCSQLPRGGSTHGEEFGYLNPDQHDPRYAGDIGMYGAHCGLDNVLLAWTGPEYIYHWLKFNRVEIPEDGLRLVRLAPLEDWHSPSQNDFSGCYSKLANEDDEEIKSFVAEFASLLQTQQCPDFSDELTCEDCDKLWATHYASIAIKYHANEFELMW